MFKLTKLFNRKILVAGLLFFSFTMYAQSGDKMKLWYDKPAGDVWENALPIGNGFQGAMVYGNVDKEIIQLNEYTVWSGSPNRNDNPLALDSLEAIRKLIFNGSQKAAEHLANKVLVSKKSQGQMYQTVGALHLIFPEQDQDIYKDYYRELDIGKAVAKTTYKIGDVTYTREVLASFPDRVIVMHLSADKPASLSFNAYYSTPQPRAVIKTTSDKELIMSGTTMGHETVKGKVQFKGITRIKKEGGQLSTTDTSLVVNNATSATIYISIATNFNKYNDLSGDENGRAENYLNKAYQKEFNDLLKSHVTNYRKYFDRVRLDLGTTEAAKLPTDERLKNFNSVYDPQLVTLYYQFGRYLLISASQPGGQPATLQGIWNGGMHPPWDSKYTININTEMNYWPAEKTNLSEMHQPLIEMVKDLALTGQKTAKDMYGARGWMAHHNTDIWRVTGAVDGAFWGLWPNGGGWLSQHLWEHYLYSGDKKYLESIYPILKGAALFYNDYLVEHPKYHWLVVCPDESPENGAASHQGSSLDAGVTMTNQIVFDVFTTVIEAAKILHKDASFSDTLRQKRSQLPPMQIGQYGQLQEWLDDADNPDDKHRHISHLYGLFPSNQISPYRTPELYSAARNTLIQRGDISTGWSMGWKVNWWARMLDGNHAYKLIKNQLTPVGTNEGGGGTYNNLFDAHPPFQIDGNFGCVSGITEMLVQTADDNIHLLPALPDEWNSGYISGIRTKGGFEIVEMQWKDYKLVKLIIKSTLGGNLRLRVPNKIKMKNGNSLKTADGQNLNPFFYVEEGKTPIISVGADIELVNLKRSFLYDIPTTKGNIYEFLIK